MNRFTEDDGRGDVHREAGMKARVQKVYILNIIAHATPGII